MSHQLLKQFQETFNETRLAVDSFPEEKREQKLFDQWGLKDVLAHLNHWMAHDLDCLRDLKNAKTPYWASDADRFNLEGVEKRKSLSWDEVYAEFTGLGEKLFQEYQSLPDNLWDERFWPNRRFTPRIFLQIDIDHYKKEHLPVILEVFLK